MRALAPRLELPSAGWRSAKRADWERLVLVTDMELAVDVVGAAATMAEPAAEVASRAERVLGFAGLAGSTRRGLAPEGSDPEPLREEAAPGWPELAAVPPTVPAEAAGVNAPSETPDGSSSSFDDESLSSSSSSLPALAEPAAPPDPSPARLSPRLAPALDEPTAEFGVLDPSPDLSVAAPGADRAAARE